MRKSPRTVVLLLLYCLVDLIRGAPDGLFYRNSPHFTANVGSLSQVPKSVHFTFASRMACEHRAGGEDGGRIQFLSDFLQLPGRQTDRSDVLSARNLAGLPAPLWGLCLLISGTLVVSLFSSRGYFTFGNEETRGIYAYEMFPSRDVVLVRRAGD